MTIQLSPTASQVNTVLTTATFPCTITGLRWVNSWASAHNARDQIAWAIVLLKENESLGNLALGNGSTLYTPEQNVLAFGVDYIGAQTASAGFGDVEGSTKTMRKLMGGDRLVFVAKSIVGQVDFQACVQFFCKS